MKDGWKTVKLGEACQLLTGGTPSRQNSEYFGGDIRWLVSGDVNQKQIFECEGRITNLGLQNSNARLLPKNSVMIALAGQGKTRGTVAILRVEATCNQSMVCMVPKEPEKIMPEFLYYNLHGRYQEIRRLTGDDGNDRRGLNMKIIHDIEIPLPPLAEQKQIVALLDKAFAGIDEAMEKTEGSQANAEALLKSYLHATFRTPKPGWHESKLGAVGKVSMCKRILKEQTSSAGDIPFYKIGTFGKQPDAYIPISIYEDFRGKYPFPNKGDILISAAGTIGRRVRYDGKPAYFQDSNIVWIDNDERLVLNDYLYHLYSACEWNSTSGATISRLYNDDLRNVDILFPDSQSEQKAIVKTMDEVGEGIRKLGMTLQLRLEAHSKLKSSLLAQAFAGEL